MILYAERLRMEDLPAVCDDLKGLLGRLEVLQREMYVVDRRDGYNLEEACGLLEKAIGELEDADGDAAWRYE